MKLNSLFFTLCCLLVVGSVYADGEKRSFRKPTDNSLKALKAALYKTYGGKNYDAAADIIALKGGGMLLVGRSNSYGDYNDMNVNAIRLDNAGNTQWDKTYGGPETEEAFAVIETRDNGFMIVGSSDSYGGGPDMKNIWLLKLDQAGTKQWAKVLPASESIEEARSVLQNEDGSYIVLGNSIRLSTGRSEAVLVKLSEKGDQVWKRSFGGNDGNQEGAQLVKLADGGYAIGGSKEVKQGRTIWNMWLMVVDKDGFKLWDQVYGGKDNDRGNALALDGNGGFVLAGYSYSFAEGAHDAWVVRTDDKGKQLWSKNFGGPSTDEAYDVVVTRDGKIVIAGYIDIYVAGKDNENISKEGNEVLAVMLDMDGKELWKKHFGGAGSQRAYGISEDADGNLIMAGYSEMDNTDHLVLKINKSGALTTGN
jgi:hypothetical protein